MTDQKTKEIKIIISLLCPCSKAASHGRVSHAGVGFVSLTLPSRLLHPHTHTHIPSIIVLIRVYYHIYNPGPTWPVLTYLKVVREKLYRSVAIVVAVDERLEKETSAGGRCLYEIYIIRMEIEFFIFYTML